MMRFLRKLHKWLGLLIALQVILWAASGVMFAWLDHADVSAAGSVHAVEPAVLAPAAVRSEPITWLDDYAQQDLYDVRAVSLKSGTIYVKEDAPDPVPTFGTVLVQVKACGICGSDLHFAKYGGEMLALGQQMRGMPAMGEGPQLDAPRRSIYLLSSGNGG